MAAKRGLLHHDEAGALEVAHDPLSRNGGHDLIGVVDQPAGLG
jgi:hypothetical protein